MQSILQRWQELPRDDLFAFWQDEFQLRKALRQHSSSWRGLKIQDRDQFVFLRQSLAYGEYKNVFMQIMLDNLDSQAVQRGLLQGPLHLAEEFLRFLPQAISSGGSSRQNLQFLISLYREDFNDCYRDILAVLEEPECKGLLDKTANQNLRKLLKDRCAQLRQDQADVHGGLLQPGSAGDYPTIYGEKADLLRQAAGSLTGMAAAPMENLFLHITRLLETAEQLFMLGLLNECLALLHSALDQWRAGKDGLPVEDNHILAKSVSRILAKALPAFALVSDSAPYHYAAALYHAHFPEILPDHNALVYLRLYQSLRDGDGDNVDYDAIALAQGFMRLEDKNNRLADYFINGTALDEAALQTLLAGIERDVTVMPHRALAVMEILRFLNRSGRLFLSKPAFNALLRHYLDLYQWLPAAPFFNRSIWEQLSPAADYGLQTVAEKVRATAVNFTRSSIRRLWTEQPEKFINEDSATLRQKLLGSFLGGN